MQRERIQVPPVGAAFGDVEEARLGEVGSGERARQRVSSRRRREADAVSGQAVEVRERQTVVAGALHHEARGDGHRIARLDGETRRAAVGIERRRVADGRAPAAREREASHPGRGRVGAVAALEVARLVVVEPGETQRHLIPDQRDVDHCVAGVVRPAGALRVREARVHGGGELRQLRLLGDQAHRAAHGARAVQRPLRTAQHLDVIDVEHPRIDRVRQRHVVDVEARHVVAGDAADRHGARRADAIAGGSEGEVRHLGGVVEEVGDRLLLERGARESGHRHRHGLLALRALLRRDDHFLQPARLRRRLCGRVRRGSRGQPYTCDQHDPRLMHAHGLSLSSSSCCSAPRVPPRSDASSFSPESRSARAGRRPGSCASSVASS